MRTESRPASGPLARAVLSPGPGTNAAIAFLTLLVVAGATLYGALPIGLPDPVPASAPPTAFSSARARAHLRTIAQRPHPTRSPGNTGAARMFETSDDNGWVIREFAKAAPCPFGSSGDAAGYKLTGSNTDLTIFMDAGWAGMNVAYAEGMTHYHTRLDTVEELDERSLQHLGSYVLALTRHFGDADLDHTKAPEEVYFNLLGSVIHYPQGWAIHLTAFVALLFAGVVALGCRRRQLRPGGIALGSFALLASVIVAALGVYLLWTLIRALHPGGIWALQYRAPLFWIGFASLTVAITAALYVGFRKKVRGANLAVGALLWPLLFAAMAGALFPAGSFVYTWPLFFSLLGLGALFALGDRPASPWYPFAALALSAIPAVLVFAPAVYGVTLIQGLLPPF